MTFTMIKRKKSTSVVERTAQVLFTVCAFFAVLAVASITIYMIWNGAPALLQVGIGEILFSPVWKPTAQEPQYGILYVILTSVAGTGMAILIGVPIAILTAVFLAETAPGKLSKAVKPAIELLAGIPSVIYGLLGILLLNPLMYQLEQIIFRNSETHQFTGGSNLISAVIVLAVMILPTVINISEAAIRAVPEQYKAASLAMGASPVQTVFFGYSSGGQVWNHNRSRTWRGTGHRRSHGDYTCSGQLCEFSAAVFLRAFSDDRDCQ